MIAILSCACGALAVALAVAARSARLWRREAIEQTQLRHAEAAAHTEFLVKIDQLQRINRAIASSVYGVSNDQCN